jgi:hypothetical protein
MPAPEITELPEAPNRLTDSEADFINKADAFVAALGTMVEELNAFGEYFNGLGGGGNANGFAFETVNVSAGDDSITVTEYDELGKKLVLVNGHPQVSGYSNPTGAGSTTIDFDEPLPDGVVTLVTLATL